MLYDQTNGTADQVMSSHHLLHKNVTHTKKKDDVTPCDMCSLADQPLNRQLIGLVGPAFNNLYYSYM